MAATAMQPRSYWGVVSVGNPPQPGRIVESWEEATALMADNRFRLRVRTY